MIQALKEALEERGYDTLTPVQEAVTDPGLAGSDLLVSAQTGSGKTVGFGLAIGPTILGTEGRLPDPQAPLALVVAPTRELAFQVKRELEWLYARAGARVASCVGGMDMRDERRALERGAYIVVGTPGRLRDHIQRGSLDMTGLRAIVLDEADEMLDLGFREDLEFMLGEAPEDRRTLLFSATVPPSIVTLAQSYQRDAVRVTTLSERGQHADIAYQALRVAPQDTENAIINMLRYHEAQNAIVFANTRAMVSRLTARFANRGFAVVCLSGELSQSERSHALQAMRDGRARVCVATDVAARGIDLPHLELVIHAELPSSAEGLLHRSGRTGRAGRKGISALIVPPALAKKAERLMKFAKVTAEWTTAPDADAILRRDEERLLADPAFDGALTEDEARFAERLMAERSPETMAAACLRLYRARHSAPEELSPPDTRPDSRTAARDRAPFGPSTWFALSVGREDRAEPRWLLPLLCRAGGLDRTTIGAIRVQRTESFVELADAGVPGFEARLGPGGLLEEGVTARRIEGLPDLSGGSYGGTARPRDAAPRDRRPAGDSRDHGQRQGGETAPAQAARPRHDDHGSSFRDAPRPARSGPREAQPAAPATAEAPVRERPSKVGAVHKRKPVWRDDRRSADDDAPRKSRAPAGKAKGHGAPAGGRRAAAKPGRGKGTRPGEGGTQPPRRSRH